MSDAASVARAVLWPAAGLAVWGAHFGGIYAIHAHACERALESRPLLGLPWVPALVAAVTVLALVALVLLVLLAQPVKGAMEGGEPEPGFTRWFGAAACVLAGFAVLFQAAPAAVLPACW
ncbi:hypothetical protein VQH23_06875 [Pararoseomonas sp. SCSIO 73927]|uniref:hypothetical protein n=1 Tax=Pararoseomonas sp. SCSIO 73927 TaxID=3114537 RepID=UPI0030D626B7